MKKIRRILEAKWLVMLVWLAGVAVVWDTQSCQTQNLRILLLALHLQTSLWRSIQRS